MNKEFKVGDRVKVVGHPFIKEGILATVCVLGHYYYEIRFDDYEFNEKFGDIDCLIGVGKKYLEKVEDWLHFKTTRSNDPLISKIFKLDKEVELYNYMYQWKEKFDPEEVEWGNDKEHRWYISRSSGNWLTNYSYRVRQNLEIYFTTEKKAEQCLEWLKKEGVLY